MSFFVFFHAWWVGGSEASVEFYTLFFEHFPKSFDTENKFLNSIWICGQNNTRY